MSLSGHLDLIALQPDSVEQLSEADKKHLGDCPQCRVNARMLRDAHGVEDDPQGTFLSPPVPQISEAMTDRIRHLASEAISMVPLSRQSPTIQSGIDRFSRTRWLGTGPRGVVFAVRDRETGDQCALKLFSDVTADGLFRFSKIFESLVDTRHPNLIRYLGLFSRSIPPFFTMSLVRGSDLISSLWGEGDWRRVSPLSGPDPTRLRHSFRQLIVGLRELHRLGLTHGNVKPNNCLVLPDGRLVLSDMGLQQLAQVADPYVAPEILEGEPPSTTADLYSLGAVLYHALTGRAPAVGLQGRLAQAPLDTAIGELAPLAEALMNPRPDARPDFATIESELDAPTLMTFLDRPVGSSDRQSDDKAPSLPVSAAYHFGVNNDDVVLIGPYAVEAELGHGGMGVVYRCRHSETGELVALKTVRLLRKRLLSSIRREVQTLARIDHPGVVDIVDQGVFNGIPWYAMRLVEGVTLKRHQYVDEWLETVRSGEPSPEALIKLLSIVRGVCATLSHIHALGVVHRDLKPGNVLVNEQGTPVLVDFGLNMTFSGSLGREVLEVDPSMAGTTYYMAPEQIRGQFVDARADLYSLGCILYELVTGSPPFVGRSTLETLSKHLTHEPVPAKALVPGLPEELDQLIKQLLSRDTSARIGYAEDVDRVLAQLGAKSCYGGSSESVYLYRSELVGRDAEVAWLEHRIRDALDADRGAIILLAGESGVGKTRLAMELAQREAKRGAIIHTGVCQRMGLDGEPAAGALGALRGSLQAMVDRCRDYGEPEEERLLGLRGPVLAQYHPAISDLPLQRRLPPPAELPPVAAKQRLMTYLGQTYAALAHNRPLILVLDDLLWADDLTIDFLHYLLRTKMVLQNKLIVIATYRIGEGDPPVSGDEQDGLHQLILGRLDDREVERMVREMLALKTEEKDLIEFLCRHSEGNPFFVAEYLRAAVTEGWLSRVSSTGWAVSAIPRTETGPQVLPVPQSVGELVARRLAALTHNARAIAEVASVLGREVTIDLLVVAALPGVDVEFGIDELLGRDVLEPTSDGGLRFAHDKLREGAYQALHTETRKTLHGRAARALEELEDDERSPVLGQLAHHWHSAGLTNKALPVFAQAAEWSASRFAHEEAQRLYRRYLALAPAGHPGRLEVQIAMARGLGLTGARKQAITICQEALQDARDQGDLPLQGDALHLLASLSNDVGNFEEAEERGTEALAIFRQTGDRKQEGATLSNLGWTHLMRSEPRATEFFEEALSIHRAVADGKAEGRTLNRMAGAYRDQGEVTRALDLFAEALAAARSAGDRPYEGMITSNTAILLMETCEFERAHQMYLDALRIHLGVGNRSSEGITRTYLSLLQQWMGNPEATVDGYQTALQIHREVGNRRFEAVTLSYLAQSLIDLGRPAEALRSLQQALETQRDLGDRMMEAHSLRLMSCIERRTAATLDRSLELLEMAEAIVETLDNRWVEVECVCERARHELACGREARHFLKDAEKGLAELGRSAEGEADVASLRAAIHAIDAGEPVYRGESVAQLPAGLVKWLVRGGRLERNDLS